MEENLPNDRLEEFLKNAFKGHSENPSEDLWDRIAQELPSAAPVPQAPVVKFRRWWALAAAAAVAGIVIGQHFYFQYKLQQLSSQLEKNAVELQRLESGSNQGSGSGQAGTVQVDTTSEIQHNEQKRLLIQEVASDQFRESNKGRPATSPTGSRQGGGGLNTPTTTKPMLENGGTTPLAIEPMPLAGQLPAEETARPVPETAKTNPTVAPERTPVPSPLGFSPATLLTGSFDKQPDVRLPENPIVPAARKGKTSVGIHATAAAVMERIDAQHIPGPGPGPGGPGQQDRKVFVEDMESNGQTIMAGVALETKLSPKFFIGTGLDYRKTSFTSKHIADFKFKERRNHHDHQPGNGDNYHDFEYDLGTPAGLVTVDLRAVSTDTTIKLDNDEKIDLEISTRQDLEFVSVPLYAGYRIGEGRLKFLLKGGVLLNFLRANDFEIAGIKQGNNKFEFQPKNQPMGDPQDLQTVSVDFVAGLGLDYSLTKSLSLRLEPTVSGSLTSLHNSPYIQSSQYSAGLNAGVIYNF